MVLGQEIQAGAQSALYLTTATLVKGGLGRVAKVNVIVAGSAAGSVNDVGIAAGAVAGNQIAVIPNTVGTYDINFPFFNGLVIVPGTGQTVAVSYT